MPMRVRPVAAAVRTAKAVGADTATMMDAPLSGFLHELDGWVLWGVTGCAMVRCSTLSVSQARL
jgi:hypothetical protein